MRRDPPRTPSTLFSPTVVQRSTEASCIQDPTIPACFPSTFF